MVWPRASRARLQGEAVYGLTEFYREEITAARLVACPGCYPTAALLALVPLAKAGLDRRDDIVIDAKSGVTGAGRGLKQNTLFSEAGEGLSPYSVGMHRHAPEIEQEIGVAAGAPVTVNFTPHLIPMARGELCTSYVRLNGASADDLRAALEQAYANEPFVHVARKGVLPQTQNVRGSNYVQIGVFADRIEGRAIVISMLDNLVKGSAGQAIQNMNLMFGCPRRRGWSRSRCFRRRRIAVDEGTLQFYRSNAEAYAGGRMRTVDAADRFLALLPPGGSILELGCGAGNDSAEMLARGFRVRADRRIAGIGRRSHRSGSAVRSRRCCSTTRRGRGL